MAVASKPWWAELESRLFTKYKTQMNTALLSSYPNLKCTASPISISASKFPTAYFRMVDWVETGNDIENTDTNAIIATVQVDIVVNTSLTDCKEVIYETINIITIIIIQSIYCCGNICVC